MRALAVMHLADVTGPAKTLYPRLEALARRGELVTLVPAPGPVADLYARIGTVLVRAYDTVTRPRTLSGTLRAAIQFGRDVATFRAEIQGQAADVVVVATSSLPAALLASKLERVPAVAYVAEVFDRRPPDGLFQYVAQSALSRLTVSWSSAIVCASNAVAGRLPTSRRTRITTIAPGFRPPLRVKQAYALRDRLGIPRDALCLAVVGSLSIGRGPDVVVRALPEILARIPNTYCVFAGVPHRRAVDFAYRDGLVELTRSLGVAQRVVFAGFVDPIDEVYAAADVVINPVRMSEAFGRVPFEALAAGKPVIASRVGAIPDLLGDERHALLVEPDDPTALGDAVVRLASDAGLGHRLAAAGAELVRRRFQEEEGIRAFSAVVDDVLAQRACGRRGATRA